MASSDDEWSKKSALSSWNVLQWQNAAQAAAKQLTQKNWQKSKSNIADAGAAFVVWPGMLYLNSRGY